MAREDSVLGMWESLEKMMLERKQISPGVIANRKAMFMLGANAYAIVQKKIAFDHKQSGTSAEDGWRLLRELFEETERQADLAIAELIPFTVGTNPTQGD